MSAPRRDSVARLVAQWRNADPGADTSPIEVVARIMRLAAIFTAAEQPLQAAGLTRGEFELLGALRRAGADRTATELARETSASPAAVTKRLKALGSRGLIARQTDTADARVARIRLTPEGARVHEAAFHPQLARERELLAALPAHEREALADRLARALAALEDHASAAPSSGGRTVPGGSQRPPA